MSSNTNVEQSTNTLNCDSQEQVSARFQNFRVVINCSNAESDHENIYVKAVHFFGPNYGRKTSPTYASIIKFVEERSFRSIYRFVELWIINFNKIFETNDDETSKITVMNDFIEVLADLLKGSDTAQNSKIIRTMIQENPRNHTKDFIGFPYGTQPTSVVNSNSPQQINSIIEYTTREGTKIYVDILNINVGETI